MQMLLLTFVLIILIAICASVILCLFQKIKKVQDELEQAKKKPLELQIKELHELTTLEARYMVMLHLKKNDPLLLHFTIPGTTREVLMNFVAVTVWGCNLDNAKIQNCVEDNLIRIIVPHCDITHIYQDKKSCKVFYEKSGIFTSIKVESVYIFKNT